MEIKGGEATTTITTVYPYNNPVITCNNFIHNRRDTQSLYLIQNSTNCLALHRKAI